ncbi:hypothetical protein ACEPAG_9796 [Sanghuangporus baumii]
MHLQDLPVETIARIFAFLDWRDLLVVSQLNTFFRDVYNSFPELEYSFQLQVSGMVDTNTYLNIKNNGPGALDVRSKVEEIRRRERSWRMMDLSRNVTRVIVPHRTSHIYDLSGGVYLLGDCKHSVISRDTHSLRFFDLTSCAASGKSSASGSGSVNAGPGPAVRSDPWPEMKIEGNNIIDIGFGLQEFDVVAVVGIRPGQNGEPGSIMLSLRELSTGAPHPLAKNPDIVVDPVENNQLLQGKLSIMLEIVGPRLLLLLTWHRTLQRIRQHDEDKLLLFNWWEGTKVLSEIAPQQTWDGFVFLSPELVLLPDRERGLEIIRLPDVTKGYSAKGFERVLRLTLPALQPLVKVGAIQCRSEPNPIGETHPSVLEGKSEFAQRMRAKKRPPFAPDPKKAIVLLQVYYREFNNEPHDIFMGQWGVLRHNVSLVVHRELLLKLVDMWANKTSPSTVSENGAVNAGAEGDMVNEQRATENLDNEIEDNVPVVSWAYWGQQARWMADDTHVSNWITTSAGQRYVGSDEEGHIVVKDFNPITVRKARARMFAAAALNDTNIIWNGCDDDEMMMNGWQEDGSKSRASANVPGGFNGLDSDSDSESESGDGQQVRPELELEPHATGLPGLELMDVNMASGSGSQGTDDVDMAASASSSSFSWLTQSSSSSGAGVASFSSVPSNLPPLSSLNCLFQRAAQNHPRENRNKNYVAKQKQREEEREEEEASWKSVRLIEGYNEVEDLELQQLFSQECKWPLPCVEYVSKNRYEYHGLLMDEERIIGLKHDEHTGAIVEFDVFTL